MKVVITLDWICEEFPLLILGTYPILLGKVVAQKPVLCILGFKLPPRFLEARTEGPWYGRRVNYPGHRIPDSIVC